MALDLNVYSELKVGGDGHYYNVRYLLSEDELIGMQHAGLIGQVSQVLGITNVQDEVAAAYEAAVFEAQGGVLS